MGKNKQMGQISQYDFVALLLFNVYNDN